MAAIASTARYKEGDLEAEADYYRIHFGSTVPPELLEQVIGSLRTTFSEEGIVLARAIEQRLYEETWVRDDYDLMPALERLHIPTLVIHGDNDLVPVDVARDIASAIPDARLIVLRECGHFSFLEHPARVRACVTEFMSSP
jgi:proline iminopeptidase